MLGQQFQKKLCSGQYIDSIGDSFLPTESEHLPSALWACVSSVRMEEREFNKTGCSCPYSPSSELWAVCILVWIGKKKKCHWFCNYINIIHYLSGLRYLLTPFMHLQWNQPSCVSSNKQIFNMWPVKAFRLLFMCNCFLISLKIMWLNTFIDQLLHRNERFFNSHTIEVFSI